MNKQCTSQTWARLKSIVKNRDKYTCQYCGRITVGGEPDHVLPLKKGGTDSLENLVWACSNCNKSKAGKTLREWVNHLISIERAELVKVLGDSEWITAYRTQTSNLSETEAYKSIMLDLEAWVRSALITSRLLIGAGIPRQLTEQYMIEKLSLADGALTEWASSITQNDIQMDSSPLERLADRLSQIRLNGYPYPDAHGMDKVSLTSQGFVTTKVDYEQLKLFGEEDE